MVYVVAALAACFLCGLIIGRNSVKKDIEKKVATVMEISVKHLDMFHLMHKWMMTKRVGKHIKQFFLDNGYQTIAIYGMSFMGQCLLDELTGSGIEIAYAIDKWKSSVETQQITVFSPDGELPEADVIVVTAISHFYEIHKMLLEKTDIPVICLTDILFEL